MLNRALCFGLTLTALLGAAGCSTPPPVSGFLSDYSNLRNDNGTMRFVSPRLARYTAFIIDPVVMRAPLGNNKLTPEQTAQVVAYFEQSLAKALEAHGYPVTTHPGPGVARFRIAVTDITESTWWLKITGMGGGGAAMEGEVVDSVTGIQLGAVIQAGKGGALELNHFSTIDDLKSTIDRWSAAAVKRLDDLKNASSEK